MREIQGVTKVFPHCCQFCTFELGVKFSRMKRHWNYLYLGYCGYVHILHHHNFESVLAFALCVLVGPSAAIDFVLSDRVRQTKFALTLHYYNKSVRLISPS